MSLKPELAAFLQNNDAPSEVTILQVKESLRAPVNELQEVEAEIKRLGELMETMKTKRQRIQQIISDHQIILSPARRLPPDVLREIFLRCLPTHNPVMKCSESPLLLTRICSSWRAIAISSPRIWSKLHIPLLGDPRLSESGCGIIRDQKSLSTRHQRFAGLLRLRCDAVRTWLSRSGTCPLSLSVAYPDYFPGVQTANDDFTHEMFAILLSFAERWSDLDLSMPKAIFNKLQGTIEPTMLSFLRSLRLSLGHSLSLSHINDAQPIPIRLLAAPGLRRIALIGGQVKQTPGSAIQPDWNHITHITFAYSTTDKDLLALLSWCPNLVSGEFPFVTDDGSDESVVNHEDILLPHLESLEINGSGVPSTIAVMFNAIKAPALTRFSYRGFNRFRTNMATPTLRIPALPLLENSTLINYLSMDGGLSSQDVDECLQRVPRVTHIVIGNPPPANAYRRPDSAPPDGVDLRILTIGSSDVNLLPRLESLEAHQLSRSTDEDLLEVITSRINAFRQGETAALKDVKISFHRAPQRDIAEDVFRLSKEAGVEVKLDLTYLPEDPQLVKRLSPSFGLDATIVTLPFGFTPGLV